MKSLGIIISTPGRRSLAKTLQSIFYQREPVEDVLVVGDGFDAPTSELVSYFKDIGLPARYVATTKTRDWGHSQINYGLQQVRGDYVTYQDDDDIYLPRALEEMARLAENLDSPRPILGRVKTPILGVLWQMPGIQACLDGHCLVAPNDKRRLGWMLPQYNGDQCLLHTTIRNYPECAWADRIWTLTRPKWTLMPWRQEHGPAEGDRPEWWSWDFYRDSDLVPCAKLEMWKDERHDLMHAKLLAWAANITEDELGDVAQFVVYAGQGNDVSFTYTPGERISTVLPIWNYKEHSHTDQTHSWPPDFWPPIPPFDRFLTEDGQELLDWRDDVWGGRAV
jgi:glycosyltransferase involved in cell wall biosynthesis